MFIRRQLLLLVGFSGTIASAQQIDLSLHVTAVPDSFEVRATSSGPVFSNLPNAVFTVRWEASAGGLMNYADVRRSCGAYQLNVGLGLQTIGNYNYFTFVLLGDRNLAAAGCPITTAGQSLIGFRIRELQGCRHVALLENAFTNLNNLDYYFSIGGVDVTGAVTSAPIPGGVCGPCVPPVITDVDHAHLGPCGTGPLSLSMMATGTALDFSWWHPPSPLPLHWLPSVTLPNTTTGTYWAVATNGCGADTVEFVVSAVDYCESPVLTQAVVDHIAPTTGLLRLSAAGTGTCPTYHWVKPDGTILPQAQGTTPFFNPVAGTYRAVMTNACGADTMHLVLDEATICHPPGNGTITMNGINACMGDHVVLTGNFLIGTSLNYAWTAPNGAVVGNEPVLQVAVADSGIYTFTASNFCGSASVAFHVGGVGLWAGCIAPQLSGLTVVMAECPRGAIHLSIAFELYTDCMEFEWTGTNVVPSNPPTSATAIDAEGSYQVVVSNACGSDTVRVVVVPDTAGLGACIPPEILELVANVSSCPLDPVEFHAVVAMEETCQQHQWTGHALQSTSTPQYAMAYGAMGTYQLVVSDRCGSDTAVVEVVPDSTVNVACVPPIIHGLSAEAVCVGDTLLLVADVAMSGPCLQYGWSGAGIQDPEGLSAEVPNAANGLYTFTVSNFCGSVHQQIQAPVEPYGTMTKVICSTIPVDLDLFFHQYVVEGGYWTANGGPVDAIHDPETDLVDQYFYHAPDVVCPLFTVPIDQLSPLFDPGHDTSITVCSNALPFDLRELQTPNVTPSGSFLIAGSVGQPMNGVFDPALFGNVTHIQYYWHTFACSAVAWFHITKEQAVPWYADADGDGLGDAADSVLSCDPPEGHVQIAGDACPQLFGTVGDPCDDGDPDTTGEVIDAECTCKVSVGISDPNAAGGWSLWPNPARGQEVLVQGPAQLGPVTINVLDAIGRTVLQRTLINNGTPLPLPLHHLASGSYAVRIIVPDRVVTLRSVVE